MPQESHNSRFARTIRNQTGTNVGTPATQIRRPAIKTPKQRIEEDDMHDDEELSEIEGVEAAAEPQEEQIVVVNGLSKHFNDGEEIIRAVDGISFTCAPKQFVTISGPSGCGKSTLLYMLGSLEAPTAGEIYIHNSTSAHCMAPR